ncbi:unnamed protein product [Cylicostephanus goldi]|uniref:Uncharacterized protein n=1 Tax=Cylicostephanus goldi TaxID=71465 RepID=A0A3P6QYE6_CYLGO|nr:unnamed protein product [Cylicostephanus goldi]
MNERGETDDHDLKGMAQNRDDFEKKMEEIGVAIVGFHDSASRIKSQLNKIEYHQVSALLTQP